MSGHVMFGAYELGVVAAGVLRELAWRLRVVALLLCAKGLERAFDEGLACRAHRAGEGCELV